MYPIKPTIGVEPTDPYEKARQDILTAINSVRALPPERQEMIERELFQAVDVSAALRLMQYLLYGG